MIRPPPLAAGDRIALVTPASPVAPERIDAAVARCRELGFEPVLAPSVRETHGYLAGPDAVRAADLQRALDDDDVASVWAIRGGYGTLRILDRLDFSPLHRRPKAFIGFSDNTAVHLALAREGLVSFHGPHAGADAFGAWARRCFEQVLCCEEPPGVLPPSAGAEAPVTLRPGVAEGPLVGGNLALLAAASGTPFALRGRGRIVVIEDVGEPVYRIDRMLTQLTLSGALDGVAGIAFGHFTLVEARPRDRPLLDVLQEWVDDLGVPAVWGLPVGHVDHNWTLPLGVPARLDADAGTLEILEPAVE